MSSITVWPAAAAASRYSVSSPTNSTTPMVYMWNPPAQDQFPELTRREALQRRIPPRSGIKSIIDRRQTDRDPWLDDEQD